MSAAGLPSDRFARLSLAQRVLALAFVAVGIWYLSWRPASFNLDAPVFSVTLYAAEVLGFVCALLYLLMCWRLQVRRPLPVPEGATVAIFVPTINESVDMLRRTLLSARRVRHATEVWLLDDGNRPEMRQLADSLGCRYLARTSNEHAKAGNLNNALRHTSAEFIAIFDADHAPAEAFLQETLGFFADPKVAFVQTPQDFYNLDSFQHRVGRGSSLVWTEQSLFFRVIQPGKDRLNSAFFCGSCALVRRAALDDIGGFATGTVTEDIHTSLRLHKHGWKSVYYARALAFGLAPSTAIPFLKQRLRWGQGAMQVWRKEHLLRDSRLSWSQRLSYLATMLAYCEGWQRAIFFLAPVVVLTTGVMPIHALDAEFLMRFAPYYLLTFWVFEEVGRGHGRTLLTEQYTMMRFAVFVVATFGYFLRNLRFVVTPKSMGAAAATHRVMWPQYLVLGLSAVAIVVGFAVHWRAGTLPTGALLANVLWASLTLGIAALSIRFATRVAAFRRREYRFPLPVSARLQLAGGPVTAVATDLSPQGLRLVGFPGDKVSAGDLLRGELLLPDGRIPFAAVVRSRQQDDAPAAGCEFRWEQPEHLHRLEQFLYGSDLQWRLNGLEERGRTPLERLAALFGARETTLPAGTRWRALLAGPAGQEDLVGYISAEEGCARTVVATLLLPAFDRFEACEVTEYGLRQITGQLGDQEQIETQSAPAWRYRLSA